MKKLSLLLFLLCCPPLLAQGLIYGTYLGGSETDIAHGIVVDNLGDMYVAGLTTSSNFPVLNAFQPSLAGQANAFVSKFNSNGTLAWSTFLGGSQSDKASAVAQDQRQNLYVVGTTNSTNFPVTPHVVQTTLMGPYTNAFVAKFSPFGKLIWSTYLGGSNTEGNSIAIDPVGNVWVAGATGGPGGEDGFVTELNSTGTAIIFTKTIGGSGIDEIQSIAVLNEEAYVAGYTNSTDFPVTPGALQTTCGPSCSNYYNGFVAELGANGVAYATYLGGTKGVPGLHAPPSMGTAALNLAIGIAVDASGDAYVTGTTNTSDFPATKGAFQIKYGGTTDLPGGVAGCIDFISGQFPCGDAYVVKLNPTGTAIDWATYLGGSTADIGYSIKLDSKNDVWVGGYTQSWACETKQCKPMHIPFPTTANAFQSVKGGGLDSFLTEVAPNGSSLVYSTYYGGSNDEEAFGLAIDLQGDGYLTGRTISVDTPVSATAYQKSLAGAVNAFIAKILP